MGVGGFYALGIGMLVVAGILTAVGMNTPATRTFYGGIVEVNPVHVWPTLLGELVGLAAFFVLLVPTIALGVRLGRRAP